MATTTRDIVERAFRKIGVVATDEPMTADQAAVGLDALNMMMHGWKAQGVDISHADLALADIFTLLPEFHEGAVYQLGQRLAPDFSAAGVDGDAFLRMLQARYFTVPDSTIPLPLLRTSSQRRWWTQ